jgi:hypothetical protein
MGGNGLKKRLRDGDSDEQEETVKQGLGGQRLDEGAGNGARATRAGGRGGGGGILSFYVRIAKPQHNTIFMRQAHIQLKPNAFVSKHFISREDERIAFKALLKQ